MKNYSISSFLIILLVLFIAGCSDDEEELGPGAGSGVTPPAVNHSNNPPKVEDPAKIPVIEVPRGGGTSPGRPFPQGDSTSGLDEARDQNAVIFLMEEYLVNFEKAVNEGVFVYISHLLDPESQLYEEQIDYVLDMYERQITEKLLQYQIGTLIKSGEDTYDVIVRETYSIHYGSEGREEIKNFENTYTLVRFDESIWLIQDLIVNVVE
ncbi:TcaA NTF2-like domain-containing protein [Neobacillus niacini]|uniref:TcaA NTF2-like domain-containing protein n=1 Tax=Neobacillus niacini TaxID=86668 RepID=UPI00398314B1